MKVLVFDTETSGLPEKEASIYDKSKWPYIIKLFFLVFFILNNKIMSIFKNLKI